jgi:hypothetical protein
MILAIDAKKVAAAIKNSVTALSFFISTPYGRAQAGLGLNPSMYFIRALAGAISPLLQIVV